MIEYGTIESTRRIYLDKWIFEGNHLGNPIIGMTQALWDAMELGMGEPTIGSVFEYTQYNLMIIALDPERNLIICVNKDQPYWWFALLLYKVSTFFGWDLYA